MSAAIKISYPQESSFAIIKHLSKKSKKQTLCFRNREEQLPSYDKSPDPPKTPLHSFSDLHSIE